MGQNALRNDEMPWYSAWWYKFRKGESCFNDLWVGVVKNGCGYLVHGTLESAVS